MTPKKVGASPGGRPKSGATPKSAKRGAANSTPTGTPSKRSKQISKSLADDDDNDDDEALATFTIKQEIADIDADANPFFREATAYAATGKNQV